jgi:hypothetical protein
MRLPRALAGAVLWILASVVGLLGALLCVTIIGLPIGIYLMRLAGRSFSTSVRMMLPSSLAHPIEEAKRSVRDKGKDSAETTKDNAKQAKDTVGKNVKKAKKKKKRSWESRLGL